MTRLLHVSASPRADTSESLAIAQTFLETLAERDPHMSVETWDLWDDSLPAFGSDAVAGKYAIFAGDEHTLAQAAAWADVRKAFDRFNAADCYLFSIPMWNHGIPYVLKQFIDVVSQPGLVYGFDPESGYTGLLAAKRAVAIYTSAVYGPGRSAAFGVDFQAPYFEDWLRWAGVTLVDHVSFRPNFATADVTDRRVAAHTAARVAATRLVVQTEEPAA